MRKLYRFVVVNRVLEDFEVLDGDLNESTVHGIALRFLFNIENGAAD